MSASYLEACGKRHTRQAVLIFDEVQCGLGRTGGCSPIRPPVWSPTISRWPAARRRAADGAILLKEHVAAAVKPGDHATTFGGGPLVSTIALSVVDRIAQRRRSSPM